MKISQFLERRTPGDCVQFYYRTQKLDEFAAVRRKMQLKKRRMQVRSLAQAHENLRRWLWLLCLGFTPEILRRAPVPPEIISQRRCGSGDVVSTAAPDLHLLWPVMSLRPQRWARHRPHGPTRAH